MVLSLRPDACCTLVIAACVSASISGSAGLAVEVSYLMPSVSRIPLAYAMPNVCCFALVPA